MLLGAYLLGIMGSVLLIIFEVFVLHIVPDPLYTSIGSIVFKCEGKRYCFIFKEKRVNKE